MSKFQNKQQFKLQLPHQRAMKKHVLMPQNLNKYILSYEWEYDFYCFLAALVFWDNAFMTYMCNSLTVVYLILNFPIGTSQINKESI